MTYHDVVSAGDEDRSGFRGLGADIYKLTPSHFEAHLEAISAAVERGGSLRTKDVLADLSGSEGKPLALLHFDDGGTSALATADQLERHGWIGFFHITTDRLGTEGFLTIPELRSLHDRGHVIGSHSCSHPTRMSALPREQILREWSESRQTLEEILGEDVVVASLPGGFNSKAVSLAAAEAGLRVLFNSEPTARVKWVEGCAVLGRYAVQRSTPPRTAAQMASGSVAPRWRQAGLWTAKKIVKRVGGKRWLAVREVILRAREG